MKPKQLIDLIEKMNPYKEEMEVCVQTDGKIQPVSIHIKDEPCYYDGKAVLTTFDESNQPVLTQAVSDGYKLCMDVIMDTFNDFDEHCYHFGTPYPVYLHESCKNDKENDWHTEYAKLSQQSLEDLAYGLQYSYNDLCKKLSLKEVKPGDKQCDIENTHLIKRYTRKLMAYIRAYHWTSQMNDGTDTDTLVSLPEQNLPHLKISLNQALAPLKIFQISPGIMAITDWQRLKRLPQKTGYDMMWSYIYRHMYTKYWSKYQEINKKNLEKDVSERLTQRQQYNAAYLQMDLFASKKHRDKILDFMTGGVDAKLMALCEIAGSGKVTNKEVYRLFRGIVNPFVKKVFRNNSFYNTFMSIKWHNNQSQRYIQIRTIFDNMLKEKFSSVHTEETSHSVTGFTTKNLIKMLSQCDDDVNVLFGNLDFDPNGFEVIPSGEVVIRKAEEDPDFITPYSAKIMLNDKPLLVMRTFDYKQYFIDQVYRGKSYNIDMVKKVNIDNNELTRKLLLKATQNALDKAEDKLKKDPSYDIMSDKPLICEVCNSALMLYQYTDRSIYGPVYDRLRKKFKLHYWDMDRLLKRNSCKSN